MKSLLIVGVVADTHVPDRATSLHPALIPTLKEKKVDLILHAGDICIPRILEELNQVAPVTAVCGNRDLVFGNKLPHIQKLELAGVPVILTHGHGSWLNYMNDKVHHFFEGYRLERYMNTVRKTAGVYVNHSLETIPTVFVFGHTHRPANIWQQGSLLFNPGSPSVFQKVDFRPTLGLLYFSADAKVEGEIIELQGVSLKKRNWIAET